MLEIPPVKVYMRKKEACSDTKQKINLTWPKLIITGTCSKLLNADNL